jgi:hypothetical protein
MNGHTPVKTYQSKKLLSPGYWLYGSTAKQDSALGKNLTSVKYKVITVDDISQASPGQHYPELKNLHK